MLGRAILDHYVSRFGPYDDSGHRFFPGAACSVEVYRFPKTPLRDVYTYASIHAHPTSTLRDGHGQQFFAVARERNDVLLDLVAVCATRLCGEGEALEPWSVTQLARPIPGTRGMDWLLVAPSVFEGDPFEYLSTDGAHLRFLWVVPIFDAEARVRERDGAAALESLLFAKGVDLADLNRSPALS